jgi:hypothetical protein
VGARVKWGESKGEKSQSYSVSLRNLYNPLKNDLTETEGYVKF